MSGARGFRAARPAAVRALCVALCVALAVPAAAQTPGGIAAPPGGDVDAATLQAREEFRVGVQAYNRFAFNDALISLEKALSYRPGEGLILDWLGRAYYRAGYEDTALREWQSAAEAYGYSTGPAVLLSSKIETLRGRRSLLPVVEDDIRYVESGRYPHTNGDVTLYRQPTSVLPLDDGGAWIVAYGSNEIVRVDVNGIIRERRRGPLAGFDRPYDLAQGPDGTLYLTEFRGGRVSVLNADGEWRSYIGSKGPGPGQFVGPQNLTVDEDGYLYVVDYGNRRVSKFDPSGVFILSFGARDTSWGASGPAAFPGFRSPTGIAAAGGRVYVADSLARCVYVFDGNGAYAGTLVREGLEAPESLRVLDDGRLLAADANRVLLIDPATAIVRELGALGSGGAAARSRVAGAGMDRNGNVLAADFQAGEVTILTRLEDRASGFFVQIDRVVTDRFPVVEVELQVQDRLRRPVVGLDARNFLLTEGGRSVAEQNFLGAAYLAARADAAVLVERSPAAAALAGDLAAAARDLAAAAAASGVGIVSLVSAGERPVKERLEPDPGATPARRLEDAGRGRAADYSPRWRFDLGLRLAATDLLPAEKKRAVFFVTTGTLGDAAFEQYSLSELAAYLANNGIAFYAVLVGGAAPDAEVRYLCEQTGGAVAPLYRAEGVAPLVRGLLRRPTGSYLLSYRSSLPTDYGRAYLPVDAEVYLMDRSGRDSTGYFPPLE